MIYEILNLVGLAIIAFLWWQQQQRIDKAELVLGYILSILAEEEDDVLPDHQA